MDLPDLKPLKDAFTQSSSFLVVTPASANLDTLAAALSLYLSLKDAGKSVIIANPKPPLNEHSRLVGIDQVTQKLGHRNLVISFDYVQDAIEKVSYNVEGKKFNLVIQPKEGNPPLDPQSVNYSYEGSDAQVIFILGAKSLPELGDLYLTEKAVFDKALLVNLDNQTANAKFAAVNILDNQALSLSQLVLELVRELNLKLTPDIANNLFQGLESATQNFQHPQVNADIFETAALLLRSGATRTPSPTAAQTQQNQEFKHVLKQLQPMPPQVSQANPPASSDTPDIPSPDWLKPKIYQGSTRV